ncbi:MAG: hypothetical protein PHS16_03145 [Candidatus Colwellbacteria bacterium]|jgi:hypothetical protein|nr:hypothetical protein [Candidatus Colwellbacteria bacterium]MCK9497826.1 hypothetical protein [Candidatus Colwellbacteria bacterium]MDD3752900.1 hypothetical protein [Candidatus Colwellbacteria bacterium]MDD4819062.1 hypothetical protein [Candidatus Colwellbacteria bacterium]
MPPQFSSALYEVSFDPYAERHFIKDFKKKYRKRWDDTRKTMEFSLARIANLEGKKLIDKLGPSNNNTLIAKYDFKVDKNEESPKKSGNRCIIEVCNKTLAVKVLLVYGKNHINRPRNQETVWWKEIIKDQFGIEFI